MAVLVTSLDPVAWLIFVMPRLYRERGMRRNILDKLKNW
jgi:hypothetical protein